MNIIDKIILAILLLCAKYFFSHMYIESDGNDNVLSIKMWK